MTKIFLSSIENGYNNEILRRMDKEKIQMKYNLMSYYYIRQRTDFANAVMDRTDAVLIDSGAHSFQKGKKVDWEKYTNEYAEFIRKNDRPKILGYFEMDVDNIIGYENVLVLRKLLLKATDKIIPVWHKNRGISEFKRMCRETKGEVVAVTGFKNEDIQDKQYLMFLRYAWKCGKKVHCLGMTRTKVLDKIPFDFVDSSSWRQEAIYGRITQRNKRVKMKSYSVLSKEEKYLPYFLNYISWMERQEFYEKKWRHVLNNKNKFINIILWFVTSHLKIKLRKRNELFYENKRNVKNCVSDRFICRTYYLTFSIQFWNGAGEGGRYDEPLGYLQ